MDNATLARQNYRVGVHNMKKRAFAARSSLAALILSVSLAQAVTLTGAYAQGTSASSATPGSGDLAGTVKSAKGAEAGVWVIAETTEVGTRYAKIVVTDDFGRYVIPDLRRPPIRARSS